jgi:hypothetical protein
MVRFKPGGLDTSSASGLMGGITNPIEGAVSAIESAAASIPGLNMFLTEEKKETSSEKEYTYFKDYSDWDKILDKIKDGLKEMNPESDIEKFEFSSADAEGRKKDAKELNEKIKSKMSSWKKYTSFVHFIGLGQGGNVANECTDLLAKDDTFKSEKWAVKSVVYVAAPQYKNVHALNKASMKGKGASFSFGNLYDLTQGAIEYFDDNEKLLTLIKDSNKNALSLAVGKVKLRLVNILAIILGGLHISAGPDAAKDLDKIDQVKDEIKGLIDDILGFLKKLIDEGTSFVKLDEIPDFKNISSGFDSIPDKCVGELKSVIDDIKNKAIDGAKHTNLSLGPSDLAGVLSCLCPLFDAISGSLGVLKPKTKGGEDLAQQIIDQAGVKKVFAPAEDKPTYLPIDKEYIDKAVEAAKKNDPDMAGGLISKVHGLITKATEKTNEVKDMSAEQKQQLAEAISCLTLPMLPTKKDFYTKLVQLIPFDLEKLTKEYTGGSLMGAAGSPLESIGIKFPEKLNQSVANADAEMSRIKGYFNRNNFKMMEKIDSLYLIYNAHNLALKKSFGPIHQCIDQQTGYANYMKAKGYDNECTLEENKYKQGTKNEKENAIPTTEVKKEQAA